MSKTTTQSPDMMSLGTQLMAFRNAYLQSLAAIWSGKISKKDLVTCEEPSILPKKDPIHCINILDQTEFKQFLPNEGGNWGWNANFYLIDTGKTIYRPFNPLSNNGWLGAADLFVINIPPTPSIEYQAEALMAYYKTFPSLLGRGINEGFSPDQNIQSSYTFQEIKNLMIKIGETDLHEYYPALDKDNNLNLGTGNESGFFELSNALLSVISEVWSNPKFRDYLINPEMVIYPAGRKGSILRTDQVTFVNPWNFAIKFRQFGELTYWNQEEFRWEGLRNNEIYLGYPLEPEKDTNASANTLALARYNNTGPSYPFTCM